MKLLALVICALFGVGVMAFGQEAQVDKPIGKIGVFYSFFGDNELIQSEDLIGGPGYSGDKVYTLGMNYLYPFTKWLDFQTGVQYAHHQLTVTPNMPILPDAELTNYYVSPRTENLNVISIPVGVQVTFLKYLFVNGGFSLDFDTGVSNAFEDQTGIGLHLGCGAHYEFKNKMSLFINPYTKSHSIVSFASPDDRHRLLEAGVKVGVMVRL